MVKGIFAVAETGNCKVNCWLTMNPTQVPQVKNGEQQGHSLSLTGEFSFTCFDVAAFDRQSKSAQHGFVESKITYTDNSRQINFTEQSY